MIKSTETSITKEETEQIESEIVTVSNPFLSSHKDKKLATEKYNKVKCKCMSKEYSIKQISTVEDLHAWTSWLIAADLGKGKVVINNQVTLEEFLSTRVSESEGITYVSLEG